MPFIGNQPAESYSAFQKQDFTTSATTSYTLDHPVSNQNEIALFINFVRQEPTTAYTASGTSLTLTSATSSSDDMYCVYLGKAVQTVNPPSGSVGSSQVAASIITGQTAETSIATDDLILLSDTSASGALKKMTRANFVSGVGETNTPAFMVRLASNFTLTDQSTVKVNFDTEDFDTDSAFASNKFTVPSGEGGKYFISAQLGVSASGSVVHRSDIYIYVNGSKVATSTGFDSNNTQYSVFANIALSLDLSAGDYVEVYNYNDVSSGTPVARASDKQSYFTGFKLT